jgi:hypothetical protein
MLLVLCGSVLAASVLFVVTIACVLVAAGCLAISDHVREWRRHRRAMREAVRGG